MYGVDFAFALAGSSPKKPLSSSKNDDFCGIGFASAQIAFRVGRLGRRRRRRWLRRRRRRIRARQHALDVVRIVRRRVAWCVVAAATSDHGNAEQERRPHELFHRLEDTFGHAPCQHAVSSSSASFSPPARPRHPRSLPAPPPSVVTPPPPPPRKAPVIAAARKPAMHTYWGVNVTDDYEWLEDANAPETKAFTDAQNALMRAAIDSMPERPAIHDRVAALYGATSPDWFMVKSEAKHFFAWKSAPPKAAANPGRPRARRSTPPPRWSSRGRARPERPRSEREDDD